MNEKNETNQTNNYAKVLYRTLWRWHFYAGIFCIPFVILLALTGAIYLFKPYYEHWQERDYRGLQITGAALSPNEQISVALASVEGGKLLSYRLPQAADEAILISVQAAEVWMVYINPYTGALLSKQRKDRQLMNIVKTIHGELLLGNLGSILVELAACWAIVLIVTGLYLWWPRNASGLAGVVYPRLQQGSRFFWRDLHAVTGIWLSSFALFLLITGLPWALVWGAALKEVRAINVAPVQQDWTQSSHQEHKAWRAQASDYFDLTPAIVATTQQLKLAAPVELSVADAQQGIWKASSQTQDRPARVDAWVNSDGSLQKRSDFAQKSLLDRAIGFGIAAHEGALFGWFNLVLGVLTCAGLILMSVSGFVLWRKRKPAACLGAPPAQSTRLGAGVLIITLLLAVFLPVLAFSILALLLLEFTVLRRISVLRSWLGLSAN